jgi:putative transposase
MIWGALQQKWLKYTKLKKDDIFSNGKQRRKVKARSLLCFWTVRELGIILIDLARQLGLSVPAIRYSVERGEIIARESGYRLLE